MTLPDFAPDSQRKWFVYHDSKEMGPLAELEVLEKIKSREFTDATYVFTEGMKDWVLATEIAHFKGILSPVAPAAEAVPEARQTVVSHAVAEVEAPAPEPEPEPLPRATAEPTLQTPASVAEPVLRKDAPAAAPSARRKVIGLLLLVTSLVAIAIYWMDQGGTLPLLNASKKEEVKTAPEAIAPKEVAAPAKAAFSWTELTQLRASRDSKAPPFRLAPAPLDPVNGIVVGALSGLLTAQELQVAVYPDPLKSLAVIPRVHFLKVPVVDGYFTVGPFLENNRAPSPGTYRMMVRMGALFLGDVAFDLGTWPADADVAKRKEEIVRERTLIADKEKGALEAKLGELTSALEQLQAHGKLALKGPAGLAEWKAKIRPWSENLARAEEEQRRVLTGPMFYPQSQLNVSAFMQDLALQRDALQTIAQQGIRAFEARQKMGLGQLWAQLLKKRELLGGELQTLGAPSTELTIDPDIVKKRLMAEENHS